MSSSVAPERTETQERILDAAERLFAARGFAATSLRAITSEAGVNVAAVHYHFGSREALLRAVIERRVEPINRARLERLDALESAGVAPRLETLLEAFLGPAVEAVRTDPGMARVTGLLFSEPAEHVRTLVMEVFREVALRFQAALERALPGLGPAEARERLGFVVGVLVHELAGHHPGLEGGPPGGAARGDGAALGRMVRFLAAGLRAPATRGGSA